MGAHRVSGARSKTILNAVLETARRVRRPGFLHGRLGGPERLLPVSVAALVLVASILSVAPSAGSTPGASGGVGNVMGAGTAPRLSLGGVSSGYAPDPGSVDAALGPIDGPSDSSGGVATWSGPVSGAEPGPAAINGSDPATPQPSGPYLADGTLLKPVAVDTTVTDASAKLRTYVVRSGDTLTGIAARFGVSMMSIWWANSLTSKDQLHVGQTLQIPPVTGLVVHVKDGDTLARLAASSGVSADTIVAYNGLSDRNLIIGQTLVIPGGQGAGIADPPPVASSGGSSSSGGSGRSVAVSSVSVAPPVQYSGGRLAWPVPGGYISQYFHPGHDAIDIAAPMGTPILAAAAGTVIYAGWKNNGGGYQVWLAHGSNFFTAYYHMSAVTVGIGQSVGRGQQIGRIGMTGWATGPHCHFEVWIGPISDGGYRVNPLNYL